jgi:hypothetical protein
METILNFFGLSYAKLAVVGVSLLALVGMGVTIKMQHDHVQNLELKQGTLQKGITERDNAINTMKSDTKDLQNSYQKYITDQQNQQQINDYMNSKLTDTQGLIKEYEAKPTPAKIKPLEKSLSDTYNSMNDCIAFESGKHYDKNPCK